MLALCHVFLTQGKTVSWMSKIARNKVSDLSVCVRFARELIELFSYILAIKRISLKKKALNKDMSTYR